MHSWMGLSWLFSSDPHTWFSFNSKDSNLGILLPTWLEYFGTEPETKQSQKNRLFLMMCAPHKQSALLCTADSSQDILGFCWMVLRWRQVAGSGWNFSGLACANTRLIHISVNNHKESIDAFNRGSFAVLRRGASFVSWPIRPHVAALRKGW